MTEELIIENKIKKSLVDNFTDLIEQNYQQIRTEMLTNDKCSFSFACSIVQNADVINADYALKITQKTIKDERNDIFNINQTEIKFDE
jgi:hypothetical protein